MMSTGQTVIFMAPSLTVDLFCGLMARVNENDDIPALSLVFDGGNHLVAGEILTDSIENARVDILQLWEPENSPAAFVPCLGKAIADNQHLSTVEFCSIGGCNNSLWQIF